MSAFTVTESPLFTPIIARTLTSHTADDPVAYDCVKLVVVRAGSALLFIEFHPCLKNGTKVRPIQSVQQSPTVEGKTQKHS